MSHIAKMVASDDRVGLIEAIEKATTRKELQTFWVEIRNAGHTGADLLQRVQRRLGEIQG